MRILFHIPWDLDENSIGGTENFAINMCAQFRSKGHDAFIVCTSFTKTKSLRGIPIYGRIPPEYIHAAKKGINEFFYKNAVLKEDIANYQNYCCFVEKQIKEFEYDFLILNSVLYSLIDQKRFPPNRTLVVNHENPLEFDNYWGPESYSEFVKLVCNARVQRQFKKLQFISESEYYAKLYKQDLNMNCAVVPSGVDYQYYSKLPDRNITRKKYGLHDSEIVFLVPCRLEHKQKGQDILIEAFGLIKDRMPPFKLVFSGNDPAYKENLVHLSNLAKLNKIEENVQFEGFSDIREGYALADIVLLAERFASYGFSLIQSTILGIQVIASDLPTFKELVSSVSFVKLINNTAENFADEILKIAHCVPDRKVMEGKRFADKLTWSSTAEGFIALMKKIREIDTFANQSAMSVTEDV